MGETATEDCATEPGAPDRRPLVTVVMPAYQCARFIDEAVRSTLAQNWPRLELVAVDDGSTDGTAERLEALAGEWSAPGRAMRVLRQANAGAGAARNRGIAAAQGGFIALFDADDVYHPRLIEACMARLLDDPDADVAFARAQTIDEAGRRLHGQDPFPERLGALDLLSGLMANHPVLRREAVEAVGGHDESLAAGIDLDLLLRIAIRRPDCVRVENAVLSDYRRRSGQITGDWRRMERGWRRAVEKARAAGWRPPAAALRRAYGRKCLWWVEIAYAAGDYPGARRLMREAVLRVPRRVFGRRHGCVRLASCVASLLPEAMHDALRRRFNARGAA